MNSVENEFFKEKQLNLYENLPKVFIENIQKN
jgi:hypothetical protein